MIVNYYLIKLIWLKKLNQIDFYLVQISFCWNKINHEFLFFKFSFKILRKVYPLGDFFRKINLEEI